MSKNDNGILESRNYRSGVAPKGNSDDAVVEEPQAPKFMSVRIGETGTTTPFFSVPPSSLKDKGSTRINRPNLHNASSDKIVVAESKQQGWSQPVTLKRISAFNVLSKYNVRVGKEHLDSVTDVLKEIFRTHSLQATYKDSPVTSVVCRGCVDNIEFQILIWKSRDNENQILLEVDRVSGDSILLHSKYAPLILQSVREAAKISCESKTLCAVIADPVCRGTSEEGKMQLEAIDSLMEECHQRIGCDGAVSQPPVDSALEIVNDLILSERFNARGLALETLVQLTDPFVSGVESAKTVARAVLLGSPTGNGTANWKKIQGQVLYLVGVGWWPDETNAEFSEDHAYAALTVIAQAVNYVSAADLSSLVTAARTILPAQVTLVDSLMQKVLRAHEVPHSAYFAAHILAQLCHHRVQDASVHEIVRYIDHIRRAQQIGSFCHAALEQACGRLLDALSDTTMMDDDDNMKNAVTTAEA